MLVDKSNDNYIDVLAVIEIVHGILLEFKYLSKTSSWFNKYFKIPCHDERIFTKL